MKNILDDHLIPSKPSIDWFMFSLWMAYPVTMLILCITIILDVIHVPDKIAFIIPFTQKHELLITLVGGLLFALCVAKASNVTINYPHENH
jgi:hypothetical protein